MHSGWTYDYTFRNFGRLTTNAVGNIRILTLVHPVNRESVLSASREDQNLFYLNAFFCPRCAADGNGLLVYGEGLPPGFTIGGSQVGPFSGALDIVAHELTHLIANVTSGLGIAMRPVRSTRRSRTSGARPSSSSFKSRATDRSRQTT